MTYPGVGDHLKAVAHGVERWLAKGVGVHFLPPYCPESNQIEILWRKIKYEWLPLRIAIAAADQRARPSRGAAVSSGWTPPGFRSAR